MADTTPLRKQSNTSGPASFADIDVKTPTERFHIHSQGLYGDHQYADLSLILRPRTLQRVS